MTEQELKKRQREVIRRIAEAPVVSDRDFAELRAINKELEKYEKV